MKWGPSFPTVAVLEAGLARTDDALASRTLEKHTFCARLREQGT